MYKEHAEQPLYHTAWHCVKHSYLTALPYVQERRRSLDKNCKYSTITMASKSHFNIYTTYYESFLALSVSIRVDKHQLMIETPSSSQAPVLRYRDITFTTEYLKESLSAVCPLLGVHNVARVRQGATLPLVEVDFTDEKALERFCKSRNDGMYSITKLYHLYMQLN